MYLFFGNVNIVFFTLFLSVVCPGDLCDSRDWFIRGIRLAFRAALQTLNCTSCSSRMCAVPKDMISGVDLSKKLFMFVTKNSPADVNLWQCILTFYFFDSLQLWPWLTFLPNSFLLMYVAKKIICRFDHSMKTTTLKELLH